MFLPTGFRFDHDVQNGNHFSHGSDHRRFELFPIGNETVEKCFERLVPLDGTERSHIQSGAHVRSLTFDVSCSRLP